MRLIDAGLLNALKSEQYRLAILVDAAFFDGILPDNSRITDWDQDVVYNGSVYHSHGFNFDSIKYSSAEIIDSINLNIDDVSREFYQKLINKGNEIINVYVYLCILDQYGIVVSGADTKIYEGWINSWSYSPGLAKVQVASILSQWGRVSTSKYSASCRWREFGGTECKHSVLPGEECDRTYNTCNGYSNTDNFGGFRWLPDLIDKSLIPEE